MKNQEHKNIHFNKLFIPHFPYEEYGIKGVGKYRYPIISMDKFINHDQDDLLHAECCKGLALTDDYKMGMIYGSLPPEEDFRFSSRSWTDILKNIKDYDPTGIHIKAIEDIINTNTNNTMQKIYKYVYYAMGGIIPWFYACYLKHSSFKNKTNHSDNWTENAKYFPNLLKYIETLPFKHIGRILFFTTYPKSGVIIHRDSVVAEHKDHNINLFFSGGWRPSFIWDEKTKEKIYLEQNSKSYFFNNRDYHGVDSENNFRYTLRIDGTFTDELCEHLGLEDGYTWKWKYENN